MKTTSQTTAAQTAPAFLPLLFPTVSGYTVTPLPRPAHLVELYARDNRAVADFQVNWEGKDGPKKTKVNLYFHTDRAPLPYGYSTNGEDNGGELSFHSVKDAHGRGATELTDYDGGFFLPKSVCAALRAHGLTVSDDCLNSPL